MTRAGVPSGRSASDHLEALRHRTRYTAERRTSLDLPSKEGS